jgi:hypothetical protein
VFVYLRLIKLFRSMGKEELVRLVPKRFASVPFRAIWMILVASYVLSSCMV